MDKRTRKVLHSSDKNDWGTPQKFFDLLDYEFHFDLDVCADEHNTKVPERYLTKEQDALTTNWFQLPDVKTAFMNPPFSEKYIGKDGKEHTRRLIPTWVEKAYGESLCGLTVVVLIPARTGTLWWKLYAGRASEIRYVTGRIKFVGAKAPAPFDSAVVIFGSEREGHPTIHRFMNRDTGELSIAQYHGWPKLSLASERSHKTKGYLGYGMP